MAIRTLAEIHRLAREKAMESLFTEAEELVLFGYRLAMEDMKNENQVCLPQSVTVIEEPTDGSVPSFETFWNLYDKKRAKPECEKLWNKLSKAEKIDACQYIPLYIEANPNKKFRQDPSRFLRRKSWNDEIINDDEYGTATTQERNYIAEQADYLSQLNRKRGTNQG